MALTTVMLGGSLTALFGEGVHRVGRWRTSPWGKMVGGAGKGGPGAHILVLSGILSPSPALVAMVTVAAFQG